MRSFDNLKGLFMRKFRWIAVCVLIFFLCGTTLTAQVDSDATTTLSSQIPDSSHSDPMSLSPQVPTEKAPKSDAEVRAERQLEK